MTKSILIVGYGRAGQRHARALDTLRIKYKTIDPNAPADYVSLDEALEDEGKYSRAVICTPPNLHLAQISHCVDYGMDVLCEKPLCGLGQLNDMQELVQPSDYGHVMMAYNYRYSDTLLYARKKFNDNPCVRPGAGWGLFSEQYRKSSIPEWGLLLDHVSHDVDIISWLSGGITSVSMAAHSKSHNQESWEIHGLVAGNRPFKIEERVWEHPMERDVHMITPVGLIPVVASENMFMNTWKAFLRNDYYPGIKEAIETQQWLEEIARIGLEDSKC